MKGLLHAIFLQVINECYLVTCHPEPLFSCKLARYHPTHDSLIKSTAYYLKLVYKLEIVNLYYYLYYRLRVGKHSKDNFNFLQALWMQHVTQIFQGSFVMF